VAAFDTEMAVVRIGPSDAPAVIFVPGTGAWSAMWRPYMEQVVALGFQAIALDLPPFGYSIPPPSGDYGKEVQGQRILAAIDALGIKRATFIVHSIGSAPLMEALLKDPSRVAKLILVSPALGLDRPQTDGAESSAQRWLRKPWLGETLSACCFTNTALSTLLVKHFVAEKQKISDAWVDLFKTGFRLSGTARNVAQWIPELIAPRGHLPSDESSSYEAIAFPVTIIWGADDQITPLSQGRHLHALIPSSILSILPGGHVPMIEEPERFSEALKASLDIRAQ
jgi:pimeloyl-ACP methyl ester carboxylesterase